MDLRDAKLGDRYRIFVNSQKEISDKASKYTVLTTVIAIKRETGTGLILGWKKGEDRPMNVSPRANTSSSNDYVPDQSLYSYGKSFPRDHIVASKIVDGVDGFPCKRCGSFYEYAVPNQDDGTLICWSCRAIW